MLIYIVAINILGLILMRHDKLQSKWPGARRVPENSLLLVSLVGGVVGVILAMKLFRHKTRHMKFTIGVPVILALQVIMFALISWSGAYRLL